ncbi:hypothetical protein [Azohydromonas lata]|uniref:hypothetical protein n=1 Tax=Azohydromonas lata TaxID=45677 RepID=UPI00083578AF|nr:hypothetical protein [Azohydromonas lata]
MNRSDDVKTQAPLGWVVFLACWPWLRFVLGFVCVVAGLVFGAAGFVLAFVALAVLSYKVATTDPDTLR